MNKKRLLATLAGGVFAFLLGWLIFGILLMDFYTENTTSYPGLFKEPMSMWTISTGCFLWTFLIAWVYSRSSGEKSILGGTVTGAMLGLLVAAFFDLNFLGNWNLYSPTLLIVDVFVNTFYSACIGAVAGWILKDKRAE